MAQKRARVRNRIYWRERGGERRAYGDFRDFADVGGGREALTPLGASAATTDRVVAEALAAKRLAELQERRRNKTLLGVARESTLSEYVQHHLEEKRRAGRITPHWQEHTQRQLAAAIRFFGADRDLVSITVCDLQDFAAWLAQQPNGRGSTLADGSRRQYLNALSNLSSAAPRARAT